MRVNWSEVLLTVIIVFWVGTCAVNRHLERQCMVQCAHQIVPGCEQCVRTVQECEILCGR